MRSWILSGLTFLASYASANYAKADGPESQRPFPHPVGLAISFERMSFETREPIIARITLTNHGGSTFRLKTRRGGAPADIGLDVAPIDQPYRTYALLLKSSAPETDEIELQPGASTAGDLLVLLDYGQSSYVFPRMGSYQVRCHWAPGREFAKIFSDEVQVTVESSSAVNTGLLTEIERVAMKYHGLKLSELDQLTPSDARKGLEREGLLVLARIIRQQKPHLVVPEMYPSQQRESEMVARLENLLLRYPDSSYSAYIARYLGLVYVKSLEHKVSHAGGDHWDTARIQAQPDYPKALRYLKEAAEKDLWPRTTAIVNLGRLHALAKEWDKAEECVNLLRTRCADVNGSRVSDELERGIRKFREKTERRNSGG